MTRNRTEAVTLPEIPICRICNGTGARKTGIMVGGLKLSLDDHGGVRELTEPCPECATTPPGGRMTRPRSEAVTLPEIRISRDTPTIPAPRLSEPLTHEQWIEMQRAFCDLAEHERALLLDVARELRAKPLPAGKRVAWSAIVVVDRELEAFRMGVVE